MLPDELPANLLFVSAGSGITPIMSMLRCLERRRGLDDVVHLHSARTPQDVIFATQLRGLAQRHPGMVLHERHTDRQARFTPVDLEELCPDWRERATFASGPGDLLDALIDHWEAEGDPRRLYMERFQPVIGAPGGASGEGGSVRFVRSAVQAASDGSQPILVAGEEAGARLPFGCRMGVCHTCIGRLCSGRVRDLRTGEVSGADGEMVRTCVNAPEGAVVIDL